MREGKNSRRWKCLNLECKSKEFILVMDNKRLYIRCYKCQDEVWGSR